MTQKVLLIVLMSLMKNSFSFNERVKNFCSVNLCKFLLCNHFHFPFCQQHQQRLFVWFREKYSHSHSKRNYWGKILNSWENFQLKRKFLTQEKTLKFEENSQLKRKFSIPERILNSGENSQLRRKFSIQEKILILKENYQLRRKLPTQEKFSTQKKILLKRKVKNSGDT